MQLYTHPMSSNGRRCAMVAKLTGVPVETIVVDLGKGENRAPAFLAINPNHKIPVLVDGDLRLWESGAICQYLAGKAGRTDLWPSEPAAQADVSRWMLWNHTHWAPPIATIGWERVLKPMFGMGDGDEALVEAKLAEYAEQARVLDAHLAGREWVAQDRLTLADIQLACTLTYAGLSRLPLSDSPNLSAWFARVSALPAWKETELPGR